MRSEQKETVAEIELTVLHDQTRRDDHRTRLALAENGLQALFDNIRRAAPAHRADGHGR